MLAKDPRQRFADGGGLVAALAALPAFADDEADPAARSVSVPRPSVLRGALQELLCVVLASARPSVSGHDETMAVVTSALLEDGQRELLRVLREMGAHADFLLDGSLVAVFQSFSSATDQAVQAAGAALFIHERWAGAQVAVATGRGQRPGEVPMGEALERAGRLLTAAGAGSGSTEVRLDEVTSGLVAGRFEVQRSGREFFLRGARAALDESRPLLGRPTPCVGRERELAQLESELLATVDEPMAHAVLVTGQPGSGKSRLRHEFLRRVEARQKGVRVLIARGAQLATGAAFALIGQALRGLCAVRDGDSPAEQRMRFESRIRAHLSPESAARVLPFLAELCQIGSADEASEQVRAARLDPTLMHERLCRALVEFLSAECAVHPVLLILEDLHWGDAPTVRILDVALRELGELPFMVLALARPEVHEQFPDLWERRQLSVISLPGLPRRACERLIREVLGTRLPPEVEARIISQAAGNALFLEELIRAAAEGQTEGVPETVLAMLQARLSQLQPASRTALCAASLFGSVFWRGGVAALLGPGSAAQLDASLRELTELEIIQPHASPRLVGESEYGFRHDLVRDAAHSLLSEEDRTLGHFMAAQYLESAGEREAQILAEHYRRGGAPLQAARWYRRAAEQALDANELQAARRRAQSALDAGAQGEERGQLYGLLAAAAYWQRDDGETRRCAAKALEFLAPGTPDYYKSAAQLLVASGRLADWDEVRRRLDAVLAARPAPGAIAALTLCLSRTGFMFMLQGRLVEMKQIADEISTRAAELPDSEPGALAQLNHFRSGYSMLSGDTVAGIRYMEATIAAFERAGDQRNLQFERSNLACMYVEAGLVDEAERLCRINVLSCDGAKAQSAGTLARIILGYGLTFSPDRRAESRVHLDEALARSTEESNRRHQGWAQAALARLSYLEDRLDESEERALAAIELVASAPTFQAWPLGWLARVLVKRGRAAEGLARAEQALLNLKSMGGYTMDISVPVLAHIEALLALGRSDEAAQAIRSARRRLMRRADRITDPTWRGRFVAHPENAQLLAFPE